MSVIARMLDANVNRAREAMRVMEDVARFALNNAGLCSQLKSMRHDLRAALETLPPGWLEANRDAPADVGAEISTSAEFQRSGLMDVAVAAGKRLTEALRVIEELLKTINASAAQQIKSLRYRAYDADSRLQLGLGSGRARQWKLCVILTRSVCRRSWEEVLRAAVENGAECVQVREKQISDAELRKTVCQAVKMARPAGVSVVVNDRADIALAAGADGVHLGQSDLSVRGVRRIAGRTLIIGVSTHDADEARAAIEAGADYCGVGSMFATAIKPDRRPSGASYLREFLDQYPTAPHLAIGGITGQNIHQVIEHGARGVAVCAAICAADDPAGAVRDLIEALEAVEAGPVPTRRSSIEAPSGAASSALIPCSTGAIQS